MSKDFVIIFLGLIAHFALQEGNTKFERAVLTRADNHTPVLFLRDAEVQKPPKPFPLTALPVCPGGPIAGVTCYDLTRVHLKIQGLPTGPLGSIDPHLTQLTKITDGTNAEPEVVNATPFTHEFAYVDYSGGCLKAPKLNNPEISWGPPPQPSDPKCKPSGQGGPYCVPLYTTYDSTPAGSVVVLYVVEGPAVNASTPPKMRQITLGHDSTIAVVNLSPPMPGPLHPSDYQEHLWLNDGNCMLKMNRGEKDCRATAADTLSCDGTYQLPERGFTDTLTVAGFVDRFVNGSVNDSAKPFGNRYSLEVECGQTQEPPPP